MSPIDDSQGYELTYSEAFLAWRNSLRDLAALARIGARLQRLEEGHWGDAKSVADDIVELRLHFGPGYRLYVTQRGRKLVILLTGGDKSSQSRDIAKAKRLSQEFDDAS
ncbi:MAG: type II toxin-antitoxin system RelE/ParE family toxin [Pseudomonadota bacterium]